MIFKNQDGRELIVTCKCGEDEGLHIKIGRDDRNYMDQYYLSGNFYSDQECVIRAIVKKIKKIWAIIMNKDFYYAEIIMSKREFETYKDWLNQF